MASGENGGVLVDNRTELPDVVVERAVEEHLVKDSFIETASIVGQNVRTFQGYDGGSLMHRAKFKPPVSIIEEIKLARDLADRDDDVAATIGQMLAVAFGDGMENFHQDQQSVTLFNAVARAMNLDSVAKEIYREYLIASQFTTVSLYRRQNFPFQPEGGDGRSRRTFSVASPLVGVLASEHIVVLGSDLFHNAELAYDPGDDRHLRTWLEEFFSPRTTPARKAEMRREDPVAASLYVEAIPYKDPELLFSLSAKTVYRLNPRMVARTSMPKGAERHPRPILTRNLPLLEAKRLLNLMDHALLQGGVNFIVVAKKGSDERPAQQPEIDNLHDVVRRASRTGVIVGDHRLSFEIVTPSLDELLNAGKRRLIGRKIAAGLLRLPEHSTDNADAAGMEAELEFIARVVSSDRRDIRRHIENEIYKETADRNTRVFAKGPAKLWFPKIVLSGTQFFTDYVLKLRDRGDIPRKWAVEAAGFDYEAALAQREIEVARGDDDTLMPADVPFSNPAAGPQDNGPGRPSGTSPNNGAPGARTGPGPDPADRRRRRTITRNKGETVKAYYDEDEGAYRAGALTHAILEQYHDTSEVGRMTKIERHALDQERPTRVGAISVVPVNPDYDVNDVRAVRLTEGISMLVGERRVDRALVAKALCFRDPLTHLDAEETALRWGFEVDEWEPELRPDPAPTPTPEPEEEEHAQVQPGQPIVIQVGGDRGAIELVRDPETGAITGTRPVKAEGE